MELRSRRGRVGTRDRSSASDFSNREADMRDTITGPSRRDALKLGAGVGLLGVGCGSDKSVDTHAEDTSVTEVEGAAPREEEPAPWSPSETLDTDRFPFGVQVGDATQATARVHLRTHVGPVDMVLMVADGDGWSEVSRETGLTPSAVPVTVDSGPEGMAVVVDLTDLSGDTAYSVVFIEGSLRSHVARFRTATEAGSNRLVIFGATSCFGGNDPWPSLLQAATEQLDFFALLGDSVYADGSTSVSDYRAHWDLALSTEGLVAVSASTSLIVTWDDHEVDNNWDIEEIGEERLAIASACFREALPFVDSGVGTGIWRKLNWGDTLDVLVLDGRGERDYTTLQYMSAEQETWLLTELAASTARFKIILNSVPITDLNAIFASGGIADRWEGFPTQRARILSAIADAGLTGVLWVAGDVHYAQVGRVDPSGGVADDVYEVFAGPTGSFLNVAADLFVGDPQYEWMVAAYNWCRFECDPVLGTVRVTHIGDDGTALHDVTLSL